MKVYLTLAIICLASCATSSYGTDYNKRLRKQNQCLSECGEPNMDSPHTYQAYYDCSNKCYINN